MAGSKQKRYASAGNPTVKAAVKSLYRLESEDQALARIAQLREHFVVSKRSTAANAVTLWIRGYEVTEAETAQGYLGNFALVSYMQKGKKFTLYATKLEVPLKEHPQRKRPKQRHPDWGHPILRDIKKARVYESIDVAGGELMRLHEDFPEVSIPDENRLLLILYEKTEGSKSPVQKYKFAVKALAEGGYIIEYKKNTRASKPPTSRSADPSSPAPKSGEAKGYFASMVHLKRRRKSTKPSGQ